MSYCANMPLYGCAMMTSWTESIHITVPLWGNHPAIGVSTPQKQQCRYLIFSLNLPEQAVELLKNSRFGGNFVTLMWRHCNNTTINFGGGRGGWVWGGGPQHLFITNDIIWRNLFASESLEWRRNVQQQHPHIYNTDGGTWYCLSWSYQTKPAKIPSQKQKNICLVYVYLTTSQTFIGPKQNRKSSIIWFYGC